MNPRLAELVERARDDALSAAEDGELASLLAQPAERAEAVAQWRGGLLLAALAARPAGDVSALVRNVASSRASQVHSRVRRQVRSQVRSQVAWRRMRWAAEILLAAGLLAAIGLVVLQLGPAQVAEPAGIAILGDASSGVQVLRDGAPAFTQPGMVLLARDQIQVDGGIGCLAIVQYPDRSRMEASAGTMLRLWVEAGAKRVHLDRGMVHCMVTKQEPGAAMRLLTRQAEVEVVGTRFTLRAEAALTRLEVTEGMVSFQRVDGTAVQIAGGGSAEAGIAGPSTPTMLYAFDFEDGVRPPTWTVGTIDTGPSRGGNRFCLAGETAAPFTKVQLDAGAGRSLFAFADGLELSFDYWVDETVGSLDFVVWDETQQGSFGSMDRFLPIAPQAQRSWQRATVRIEEWKADDGRRMRNGDRIRQLSIQVGQQGGRLYIDNMRLVGHRTTVP